jgi:hypothetical protein
VHPVHRTPAAALAVTAAVLTAGAVEIGYVITVAVYPLATQTAPRLYLIAAAATVVAGVIIAAVLRLAAARRLRSAALSDVH